MTEEIWKATYISDHYMVSNMGRIKSLGRPVYKSNGSLLKTVKGKVLNPFISKSTGYYQVKIFKKINVHRLVARAFCLGESYEKWQVNHKNGDRADNRASNLEWVSAQENVLHGFRSNGRVPTSTGKFSKEHATSKPVISCSTDHKSLIFWHCALDAVRAVGADSSSISRASRFGGNHKNMVWYTPERYLAAYEQYRSKA